MAISFRQFLVLAVFCLLSLTRAETESNEVDSEDESLSESLPQGSFSVELTLHRHEREPQEEAEFESFLEHQQEAAFLELEVARVF